MVADTGNERSVEGGRALDSGTRASIGRKLAGGRFEGKVSPQLLKQGDRRDGG